MANMVNGTARRVVGDHLTRYAVRELGRGEAKCLAVIADPEVAGTYLGLMEDADGRWVMLLVGRDVVKDSLEVADFYDNGGLLGTPLLSV
jgi:hypothetical protein